MSKIKHISHLFVITLILFSTIVSAQSLEESLRAAEDGDLGVIQRLLDRGNSPDTSDSTGNTLLMVASRQGHLALVKFLIERKSSVLHKNKFGDTAMSLASLKGKVDVANALLANGAELNPSGWTPLHYAAFEGHAHMVKFLLENGANKDAIAPNEFSALMMAVRGQHLDAARTLLYADAALGIRASGGETALSLAAQKKFQPMVELLKRAGAVE